MNFVLKQVKYLNSLSSFSSFYRLDSYITATKHVQAFNFCAEILISYILDNNAMSSGNQSKEMKTKRKKESTTYIVIM